MPINIISTFTNCIASVQLKLSDYFSKIPTIKDGIVSRLSENRTRNINNSAELVLHIGNRFEIQNPHCPACSSSKIIKQEYYPRNLKLAEFGQQTVYVRRYFCKACNKKFATPLDIIVEKGHQYARVYQKQVLKSYKTGYCSFRHIEKIFRSIYSESPTHQTIYNWIEELSTEPTTEGISKNSGYYCYDEQYLRINGKRYYRLSLIDSILNKPIAEEIANNIEYNTVKSFIKKAISNKLIYAITTDHRRKYKRIMDELRINHQLCIFHLFRMIGKEVYKKLNSKLLSNRDKIRICITHTEIKEIFRTFNLNIAINRLETLLTHITEIPKLFHKPIRKILQDFDRLTLFMRDKLVSRTTNPIENYYRNTIPDPLKRIFKSPDGVLNYLNTKKEYWIRHISKNI
jgi:transposase-like protein